MTLRNKYRDFKMKMSNQDLIMESLMKTINNWKDSFKIDRNLQGKSYPNPKYGRMFITT